MVPGMRTGEILHLLGQLFIHAPGGFVHRR